MKPSLEHIFLHITVEPQDHLASDIVRTLRLRRRRSFQLAMSGYAVMAIVSLSATVPAIINLFSQLAHTGFFSYATLAFSDTRSILVYWKQFGATLLEATPMWSLTLVLGLIFIVAWSTRKVIRKSYGLTEAISS